ncbi:MAG: PhnD/SsuA/transferrin family substrate-binding protein [Actinomycetota bacterium]
MSIATLPMYDWPEVRHDVDRLWRSLAEAFDDHELDPPSGLDRTRSLDDRWLDPDLLLGQTCGLPLVQRLGPEVAVLGTFDHGLPDTRPGDYHSVIVVPADDDATSLADLVDAAVAVNGADSQSGHGVWRHEFVTAGIDRSHLGPAIETGSHRGSIQAVADGRARCAAVDAVSWALAVRHEPAAGRCRVAWRTDPTPALPLITARTNRPLLDPMRAAIAAAVDALPATTADALLVYAFVPRLDDDYQVIAERWNAAEATRVGRLA